MRKTSTSPQDKRKPSTFLDRYRRQARHSIWYEEGEPPAFNDLFGRLPPLQTRPVNRIDTGQSPTDIHPGTRIPVPKTWTDSHEQTSFTESSRPYNFTDSYEPEPQDRPSGPPALPTSPPPALIGFPLLPPPPPPPLSSDNFQDPQFGKPRPDLSVEEKAKIEMEGPASTNLSRHAGLRNRLFSRLKPGNAIAHGNLQRLKTSTAGAAAHPSASFLSASVSRTCMKRTVIAEFDKGK